MRVQEIMQPGCPTALFQGDVKFAAQAANKIQQGGRSGLDDALSRTALEYRLWEKCVPRIHDQFVDSVVYVDRSLAEAKTGERMGEGRGMASHVQTRWLFLMLW